MITERELRSIEKELGDRICAISETGGVSLTEMADYATRNLWRLLSELKQIQEQQRATVNKARATLTYV